MSSERSPHIVLNQGTVVGAKEKLPNGKFYYAYKGIPYAEPPLGKLRFKVWTQMKAPGNLIENS